MAVQGSAASKVATPKPKAAPAKATTAPKPKTTAKPKAKKLSTISGSKIGSLSGSIEDIASAIENLKQPDAINEARKLFEDQDFNYFKLGGVLSVIQANKWYTDSGYETFKDCVVQEFGVNYRKAMYLITIYNCLIEAGIEWDKVKHLGWTKLRELSQHLTETNVDKLVKAAETRTVLQLQNYLKELADKAAPKSAGTTPSEVTTMTFKVHQDQKEIIKDALTKCKKEFGTDYDAVALESIAMGYINDGVAVGEKAASKEKAAESPAPTLYDLMKAEGYERVFEEFEKLWPDIVLKVVLP